MPRSVPLALGTLLLTATPLLAVAPATAEAPARCAGKRATIVSSADKVVGTPGDDVIVVTGTGRAQVRVLADRGDDTVCVDRAGAVDVLAGPGDDTILSRAGRGTVQAQLGRGDDTYLGGDGHDLVDDSDWTGRSGRAGGRDVIRTGGGRDIVTVGDVAGATRDTVDLGSDDDYLGLLVGSTASGARLTGGTGTDVLSLSSAGTGRFAVDLGSGTATREGRPAAGWSGIERYELAASGPLGVTGTPGHDVVSVVAPARLDAALGAGDDALTVDALPDTGPGTVDGGDGADEITVRALDDLVGDVAAGTLSTGGTTLSVAAVERWTAIAGGSVSVTGSEGPDELAADGCKVTLSGRGGDDRLTTGVDGLYTAFRATTSMAISRCGRPASTLRGEAGNDVLVVDGIDYGPDPWFPRGPSPRVVLLDGGEGTDVAVGDRGRRLTCVAETQVRCEA